VSFASPLLLLALIAVPLAALGYGLLERRRARRSAAWARGAMLPNVVRRPPRELRSAPVALFLLALTFLLVGFARPQWTSNRARGAAPTIVLTFDVSGSMAADDLRPTRLAVARQLALEFLRELPSRYRVAVVTFGNTPQLVVGPTLDRSTVVAGLPSAITPRAGTAIGDAVSYAAAVIVAATGVTNPGALYRPGAVVLFSDGGQNAGGTTPEQAAVSALVDYIPVDTVAIGTPKGVVTQSVKVQGVPVSTQIPVPVQLSTLRMLSQQTDGSSFRAASVLESPAPMTEVFRNLHSSSSPGHRTADLSAVAAGVGLALMVAGIVLSGLWFWRVA
jgi:Ca-activated chloride channel homolog